MSALVDARIPYRGVGLLCSIYWVLVGLSVNYEVAHTLSFLCSADKNRKVELKKWKIANVICKLTHLAETLP